MKTPHPEAPESRIAYIREVSVDHLPDEIRAQLGNAERVYGVLSEEGEMLALARDRHMAFVVARQNDLSPVSAH